MLETLMPFHHYLLLLLLHYTREFNMYKVLLITTV
jgi:hypothetical protein